jgi:hypothetical protein
MAMLIKEKMIILIVNVLSFKNRLYSKYERKDTYRNLCPNIKNIYK